MATLTVWIFEDPAGAQEALNKMIELSKQHLVQIDSATVVSWAEARRKPKTHNYGSLTGQAALSGSFMRNAVKKIIRMGNFYSVNLFHSFSKNLVCGR